MFWHVLALFGLAWSCVAFAGLVWLCLGLLGLVWPCLAPFGSARLCWILFGQVWPHTGTLGFVWCALALNGATWPCLELLGSTLLHFAVSPLSKALLDWIGLVLLSSGLFFLKYTCSAPQLPACVSLPFGNAWSRFLFWPYFSRAFFLQPRLALVTFAETASMLLLSASSGLGFPLEGKYLQP